MFRIANTVLLLAALSSAVATQNTSDLTHRAGDDRSAPTKPPQIPFAGLANLELEFVGNTLHARIQAPSAGFLGMVLLSDSPAQTHFANILPPLLSNYVVMGYGYANGENLDLRAANTLPCTIATVYGQAVIIDGTGLGASGLVQLDMPDCPTDIADPGSSPLSWHAAPSGGV